MTQMTDRIDPPGVADERTQLMAFLDYHRATLLWKTEGLTAEQLAQTLPPSTMTLGGMLKHLALVEDNWFSVVLLGHEDDPYWASVDWDADPDWEWHTAVDDSPSSCVSCWRAPSPACANWSPTYPWSRSRSASCGPPASPSVCAGSLCT